METITQERARHIWINAQKLNTRAPFGQGAGATARAVEHLGYVQIDTINVIERCHHHILFTRIPDYRRDHLHQAQSRDKSVFEYWTHALSYIPTRDYSFFMAEMRRRARHPGPWFAKVQKSDLRKVLRRVRDGGALSIRDITDDVLVEKDHEWASRKPSKRALQLGFYTGQLTVSERLGMLKKYELTERHFAWGPRPRVAGPREVLNYQIERALRAQGLVSLDSICHLRPSLKPAVALALASRVKKGELVPLRVRGLDKISFWISPSDLEADIDPPALTHILSPFDPLVIQRRRLHGLFNYEHIFEAYVPKEKRIYGYFGLPVLVGDRFAAVLDLKTDRAGACLLVQKWTWLKGGRSAKRAIEDELHRFEKFQLSPS